MSAPELFVTSAGAVTGLGDEVAFLDGLFAGRTAVSPFVGSHEDLPPGYGAPVAFGHKDLRGLPGGRGLRPGTLTAHSFLAVCAVGRALAGAGMDEPQDAEPAEMDRRGVYLGTYTNFPDMKKHLKLVHTMGDPGAAAEGRYVIDDARIAEGMHGFTGFDFLKLMNNMPTAHAAIQVGARGPANTFLGHASVGLQAIGRARDGLLLGLADLFVAGGSGPGTLEGLCHIRHALGLLASAEADPETAAAPFDRAATGLVPGDAAAAIVLEHAASASTAGRTPRARLAGYSERYVVPTAERGPLPDATGIARCLRDVLGDAGWDASDVDLVVPSAIGLPALDRLEAQALASVFDTTRTAVAPFTGAVGFTDAGHGPLGIVVALACLERGQLPPTTGLRQPLPEAAWLGPRREARDWSGRRAVVLALSPEGSMAAVAVEAV
jgi:3-oxoacyl-(acyl-carrier-protein) synthase